MPLLFGVLLSRSPADAWLSPASALPTSAETAICTLLLLHEELLTVFFCRPIAAASVENAEHVVRVGNRGIYSFHPSGLRKRAFDITRPPSCCSARQEAGGCGSRAAVGCCSPWMVQRQRFPSSPVLSKPLRAERRMRAAANFAGVSMSAFGLAAGRDRY